MNLCKCGCGTEIADGNSFVRGHSTRLRFKKQETQNEPVNQIKSNPEKKSVIEGILRLLKKKREESIEVQNPIDLIKSLPKYEIPDVNPKKGIIGKFTNKDKKYKQVILVSKLYEPVHFWAEIKETGLLLVKNRAYKLPRDVRGDIFIWDIDKMEPLIDSSISNEDDAETSHYTYSVANIYYNLGKMEGLGILYNDIALLKLLILGAIIVSVIGIIVSYSYLSGMAANLDHIKIAIDRITTEVSNTVVTTK